MKMWSHPTVCFFFPVPHPHSSTFTPPFILEEDKRFAYSPGWQWWRSNFKFPFSFWTKKHVAYILYYEGFQIFQPWPVGKNVFYFITQFLKTTVILIMYSSLWCISSSPFYCSVLFFIFKDSSWPTELISWCINGSSHLALWKHPSHITDILQRSWYRSTYKTCAEHAFLLSPCCNL